MKCQIGISSLNEHGGRRTRPYVYTLPNSKISKLDVEKFNAQYPTIDVYRTKSFHDRFLIIDSEKGYHIGASLKDAGRKCFGINRIEDFEMIDMLLERAKNSVV